VVNFINILRTHISQERAFLPKSFCQSQNVNREKLREALSYKKRVRKMLMKLTPGVLSLSPPSTICLFELSPICCQHAVVV